MTQDVRTNQDRLARGSHKAIVRLKRNSLECCLIHGILLTAFILVVLVALMWFRDWLNF